MVYAELDQLFPDIQRIVVRHVSLCWAASPGEPAGKSDGFFWSELNRMSETLLRTKINKIPPTVKSGNANQRRGTVFCH